MTGEHTPMTPYLDFNQLGRFTMTTTTITTTEQGTEFHEVGDLGEAMAGVVNVTRWSGTRRSTNTTDSGWLVWWAQDIDCCDHQQGWQAQSVPGVWDTTGVGTWEVIDHVQCGGCGQLIVAGAVMATDDDLEATIDREAADHERQVTRPVARVTRVLRTQLAEFLAQPADEREPTGSETQPGIYADTLFGASLGWVAWDYDPRTLGSDSPEVIAVTESELTGEGMA